MLIGFGLLVWLPMTIGCFVTAVAQPEKDPWIKLAAGVFNGLIAALLISSGRKLFVGGQLKTGTAANEANGHR
jgi:hypothetical protein